MEDQPILPARLRTHPFTPEEIKRMLSGEPAQWFEPAHPYADDDVRFGASISMFVPKNGEVDESTPDSAIHVVLDDAEYRIETFLTLDQVRDLVRTLNCFIKIEDEEKARMAALAAG